MSAKARSEHQALTDFQGIASQNQVFRSFIGMGYYDCITPPVIQRNILENPGWYTQYTPYQAEISQGRLEALLNFQTMITDLTGLEIANASLLDEGTAAAEAMNMSRSLCTAPIPTPFSFPTGCFPQTIDVVKTRAWAQGIRVIVGRSRDFDFSTPVFGALVQYPATDGDDSRLLGICDARPCGRRARHGGRRPAEPDAAQAAGRIRRRHRGRQHAAVRSAAGIRRAARAYFATRDEYKRQMPGRIVGVSKDSAGRPAFRLALQTREQHIRRDKATSNICTAQVLLAIMAGMYAVYHGPEGLRKIAQRIHALTSALAEGSAAAGIQGWPGAFLRHAAASKWDPTASRPFCPPAEARRINLRNIGERRTRRQPR